MSRKGISDVITIIIILLVAVSLAGAFFIWAGRTSSSMQEGAGKQINQTTNALGQQIDVESGTGSQIVIRNKGSSSIQTNTLAVYINGTIVSCSAWADNTGAAITSIPIQQIGVCTLSAASWKCSPGAVIKATSAATLENEERCS